MTEAVILALIAALSGGAAAALVGGLFQRPKIRAESRKVAAEAGDVIEKRWQAWANKLEERIKELENRLAERDREVDGLKWALEHEKQVTRLAIVWALVMRDEIRRLLGVVPDPPQAVQDYLDENV